MRLAKNESRQFGAMFEAQVELSHARSAMGKNLTLKLNINCHCERTTVRVAI